jgi:hypothetical protein
MLVLNLCRDLPTIHHATLHIELRNLVSLSFENSLSNDLDEPFTV